MTNTNHTDFDLLEKLSLSKTFSELSQDEKIIVLKMVTEEEYNNMKELHQNMKEQNLDDIIPSSMLKDKLDKALKTKKRQSGLFHLSMPLYQSAVAAMIFFFAGLGINRIYEKPVPIASNTVEVVKYVDRPVKQIQYVTIQGKKEQNQASQLQAQTVTMENENIKNTTIPETNSDINSQQTIALANIERLTNDTNGISMEEDTILRKMMVTMY